MRKRPNPRKQSAFERFVGRSPNRPLPKEQQELLIDALSAFYKNPKTRSRSFWAFEQFDRWEFSLLGMLCALNGLPLQEIDRTDHNVECRAFLRELGFDDYDILAINEINNHTKDIEVLQARVDRYAETGERYPFPHDDLRPFDKEER